MVSLTAIARCHVCGVLAEGDAATADKASEKHTAKTGHATSTVMRPAC